MEKKTFVSVVLVGVLVIAGLVAGLILLDDDVRSSPSAFFEECKTVYYNGEGKIDLVFFSSEENARKYTDFLMGVEPFVGNKNSFNSYYIDTFIPERKLYKDIALFYHSKELLRRAASCPNDFIIVLGDEISSIRSSAYLNILSLNMAHPLSVFQHEFGHTFANLAEEYIHSGKIPKGSENCAGDCLKFLNSGGCFEGCSREELFRSIDNGVMRTLSSEEYGTFNNGLISSEIESSKSSLTGLAVGEFENCLKEKYMIIEGVYSDGKIDIIRRSFEEGCLGGNGGSGEFGYKLFDGEKIIGEDSFNAGLLFTDAPGKEVVIDGETILEMDGEVFEIEGSFFLKVPIVEFGQIEITKDEESTVTELEDVELEIPFNDMTKKGVVEKTLDIFGDRIGEFGISDDGVIKNGDDVIDVVGDEGFSWLPERDDSLIELEIIPDDFGGVTGKVIFGFKEVYFGYYFVGFVLAVVLLIVLGRKLRRKS